MPRSSFHQLSAYYICCEPLSLIYLSFFFFNDTATTEIYTLSLHDALPISSASCRRFPNPRRRKPTFTSSGKPRNLRRDRKSTRLNSSHGYISYAVFCLKKKIFSITKATCRYPAAHAQPAASVYETGACPHC